MGNTKQIVPRFSVLWSLFLLSFLASSAISAEVVVADGITASEQPPYIHAIPKSDDPENPVDRVAVAIALADSFSLAVEIPGGYWTFDEDDPTVPKFSKQPDRKKAAWIERELATALQQAGLNNQGKTTVMIDIEFNIFTPSDEYGIDPLQGGGIERRAGHIAIAEVSVSMSDRVVHHFEAWAIKSDSPATATHGGIQRVNQCAELGKDQTVTVPFVIDMLCKRFTDPLLQGETKSDRICDIENTRTRYREEFSLPWRKCLAAFQ